MEMDKQGRVVLPDRIRRRAGIKPDVTLIGVGNYLELWNKATYENFIESNWSRWSEIQQQARAASRKRTTTDS